MRAVDETVEKSGRNMHFFKVRRVVMVEFKGTGGKGGEERKPRPDWSSCPVVSKLQDFTLNIRT